MSHDSEYYNEAFKVPELPAWRIGDVYTDGTYRWKVLSVDGDKAVMQSCGSSWATTIPLTLTEWREGGRWQLEVQPWASRQ